MFVVFTVAGEFTSIANAQMIIAHRGASHNAPENTLAAFDLAWTLGADGIEADCHLTADRKIVFIHDADTSRVSPQKPSLKIAESDLATLQQVDVGSWKDSKFSAERIPVLSQVLAGVPRGKRVFLDLKTGPEILPILQAELERCSLLPEQIHLICFRSDVISQARKLMPEYSASWLVDYRKQGGGTVGAKEWRPTGERVMKKLAAIGATGVDARYVAEMIDQDFVNTVKTAGLELHVWNVDDPQSVPRLSALGVTSITTNRPALLRCFLQTANSQ